MKNKGFSAEKKEQRKTIRVVLESVVLVVLLIAIGFVFSGMKKYTSFDKMTAQLSDRGPVVVRIPGVSREHTEFSFNVEEVDNLLGGLHDMGYVTVSQEDVKAYKESGEKLPDQSFLLVFQDGKKETVSLVQNLLEKYNFKATMLEPTNEDRELAYDPNEYLTESAKETIRKNSFWEVGMDEKLPDTLKAIQTDSGWGLNHLLIRLKMSRGEEYKPEKDVSYDKLTIYHGYVDKKDNQLVLTTDSGGVGRVLVSEQNIGTNFRVVTTLAGNAKGTQSIGVRVKDKDGVFLRLADHKLQLLEKVGGQSEMIDECSLEKMFAGKNASYTFDIKLSEEFITVFVNNKIVFNNEKVHVLSEGIVTLECSNKVDKKVTGDVVYDAKFKELQVTVDGVQAYDDSMKWTESIHQYFKKKKRDFVAWIQSMD